MLDWLAFATMPGPGTTGKLGPGSPRQPPGCLPPVGLSFWRWVHRANDALLLPFTRSRACGGLSRPGARRSALENRLAVLAAASDHSTTRCCISARQSTTAIQLLTLVQFYRPAVFARLFWNLDTCSTSYLPALRCLGPVASFIGLMVILTTGDPARLPGSGSFKRVAI